MRLYLLGLLIGVSMSMVAARTQAQGPACTLDTMRAVVTQACACDTFSSHGQYNKCVRVQLNAFRAQECDTDLIRSVGRCASRSICSKPHNPVFCCKTNGRLSVTSGARCTDREGTVMTGVTSPCDAVCPAPGTPTPARTNTPAPTPSPPGGQTNLIALHDSTSTRYSRNCAQCHADVLTEKSLNPSIPSIHPVMRPYAPGSGNTQCMWCHRTVNLMQGVQSAAKSKAPLRKLVDPVLCSVCHQPGTPAKQLYQSGPSRTNPDGAQLYELVCAACHGPLASSQVHGKSANEIRGKINENEGGMGPLRVLSTQQIDAIANALAR
jgi:hypothetical protein